MNEGMAENKAELLNASKNCAKQNIAKSIYLRAGESRREVGVVVAVAEKADGK